MTQLWIFIKNQFKKIRGEKGSESCSRQGGKETKIEQIQNTGSFGSSLLQGKQYSLLTRVFLYYIPSLLPCWIFLMSSFSEVNSESYVKDKLNIWKASGIKLREASHSFRILGGVHWKKPERAYNSSILGFNSDQYITLIYYVCAETVLWLNRNENSYWLAMSAIGIAILSNNVRGVCLASLI